MTLMDGGGITVYTEVSSVCDDLISFALHYVFDDGGELVGSADMRSAASKRFL